jgi:hypothetical protein
VDLSRRRSAHGDEEWLIEIRPPLLNDTMEINPARYRNTTLIACEVSEVFSLHKPREVGGFQPRSGQAAEVLPTGLPTLIL